MLALFLILALSAILLVIGIYEKIMHQRNLNQLSLRINVNGTRGKSTVTRLITGVLKEAEMKVVGKTTGTSARIIYWDNESEKPIIRGPLGPNIIEQKHVVKEAVKSGADVFVAECMAVNPDYQIVFQEQLIQAHVGVIVNVREDHLDLCGPTLDNIAESFTSTIPYDGYLIVSSSPYNNYFRKIAESRNSKILIADESEIPYDYLSKFEYVVFLENVAIALAVAKALNIDKEVALRGMMKANPDPGALHIHPLSEGRSGYFVNAFAANDPSSTLMIWNHIQSLNLSTKTPLVILNCRPDRVDRTIQFAEEVLPYIEMDALVVMGVNVRPVTEAWENGKIKANKYLNLEGYNTEELFNNIRPLLNQRVIFGVGNIHGGGDELLEKILKHFEDGTSIKIDIPSVQKPERKLMQLRLRAKNIRFGM